MKQTMINYTKAERYDELYTPNEAIYPILKYLDKDKTYWECTDYRRKQYNKSSKRKRIQSYWYK